METLNLWTVISVVLGIVSVVFAGFWLKAKGKFVQVYLLAKEALDLVKTSVDAIEDNKITQDEITSIKTEASEVKQAWLKLLGK